MSLTTGPLQASYMSVAQTCTFIGYTHIVSQRGVVMVARSNFGGMEVEDFPVFAPQARGSVW